MRRIAIIVSTLALLVAAAGVSPARTYAHGAYAQEPSPATETVTVQLDASTPAGTHVIGTLVVQRTAGSTETGLEFRGTVDGNPATATAKATERWQGGDSAEITVTEITSWDVPLPRPQLMTVKLAAAGPNLITVNGIPVATNAPLAAPGSGNSSYVVTSPLQGLGEITFLPRTGAGPVVGDPLLVVALLVFGIPLLALMGLLVGKIRTRLHNTVADM
jgi:hypothetical protein